MKIRVDLSGLQTKEEILNKFGAIFEFGSPEGNISVSGQIQEKGWGMNWDAMNDSFGYLEEGGIWGTGKKFIFPLEIEVSDYKEFMETSPKDFQILKEILDGQMSAYRQEGKVMKVVFT